MGDIETIFKMLADPDSDNDELNCRIDAFNRRHGFFDYQYGARYRSAAKMSHLCLRNYTTSIDAAMSIGAEELKEWYIRNLHCANNEIYACEFVNKNGGGVTSLSILTLPRAIADARMKALDYIRGNLKNENAG